MNVCVGFFQRRFSNIRILYLRFEKVRSGV
jgi:hypothetical protein